MVVIDGGDSPRRGGFPLLGCTCHVLHTCANYGDPAEHSGGEELYLSMYLYGFPQLGAFTVHVYTSQARLTSPPTWSRPSSH